MKKGLILVHESKWGTTDPERGMVEGARCISVNYQMYNEGQEGGGGCHNTEKEADEAIEHYKKRFEEKKMKYSMVDFRTEPNHPLILQHKEMEEQMEREDEEEKKITAEWEKIPECTCPKPDLKIYKEDEGREGYICYLHVCKKCGGRHI